ncbi:hypothetical protein [Cohnella candidum]|uniref:hypothetical protein n=1 Tax=Cohnella candidum TaxID=2674991 RepID=UPI0013DDF807|nr:hypothetical protein [Cohnella candidum]
MKLPVLVVVLAVFFRMFDFDDTVFSDADFFNVEHVDIELFDVDFFDVELFDFDFFDVEFFDFNPFDVKGFHLFRTDVFDAVLFASEPHAASPPSSNKDVGKRPCLSFAACYRMDLGVEPYRRMNRVNCAVFPFYMKGGRALK